MDPATVDLLADYVDAGRPAMLAAATVFSVTLASREPGYRAVLERADVVLLAGMPLVWMSRAMGHRGPMYMERPALHEGPAGDPAGPCLAPRVRRHDTDREPERRSARGR